MIGCRRTISSRSIPSLSVSLICLLSVYLSTTKTVYAEQRSTTTTTNPQLHSPPSNNVQTTILPLSTNIPNDIPSNNKDKENEVNNNGGDEWKLLDGEFSSSDGVDNKIDKQTSDDSSNEQSIISDASSAMAANYISKANYNPPVGSVANNGNTDSNGNGNTANNNSGGGWFGKILGKDKQANNNDSNTAKVS